MAIGDSIGGMIPNLDAGSIASYAGLFLGVILIGVGGAFGVWYLINHLKYNKTIVVFRKIGNEIVPAFKDRAKFERVGIGGDYWCKLKKAKKTIPRPRMQMAKNTYWVYERDDFEWCNFTLKDFDADLRKTGAYFVDEDMRLQRLGIQKNLRERFQKVTFWEKYGSMITSVVYILIVSICIILVFKETSNAYRGAASMSAAVRDMAIEVANIRKATGSGAIPIESLFLPVGWLIKRLGW